MKTKEMLQRENVKLIRREVNLTEDLAIERKTNNFKDERRRKEFSKAFDWTESRTYSPGSDYRLPTWEEIFVKVGKLLYRVDEANRLKEVEDRAEAIDNRLYQLINNMEQQK